jgi:hypothetical protein
MGTYSTTRANLDCDEDHGYGRCPAEHSVSASYGRSSEYGSIIVDGQGLTVTRALLLQLHECLTDVVANGGMD